MAALRNRATTWWTIAVYARSSRSSIRRFAAAFWTLSTISAARKVYRWYRGGKSALTSAVVAERQRGSPGPSPDAPAPRPEYATSPPQPEVRRASPWLAGLAALAGTALAGSSDSRPGRNAGLGVRQNQRRDATPGWWDWRAGTRSSRSAHQPDARRSWRWQRARWRGRGGATWGE